ncbi:superoxide dismutase [Calidifontibacillus erzurumensis]|uniref:superoxide dismutase n=1 Tax=Calidifontibacillus erzurumensis TaxID=2741433 RepID=A0A8J8KA61_9BACI|nr:superoxide dismutase [Calidifontibacillus erzurumensis]NSL50469.1 superoxide dismutase [Calidifontibacillus erzurumensis]
MMNETDYKQYVLDLKQWVNQVDQILKDHVNEEAYNDWKQEMDDLVKDLEQKITENELDENDLVGLESRAKSLYEHSISLQNYDRNMIRQKRVPIGQHQLPQLPYRYDALEPYISEEIMKLHHDKHHRSYVEGLNKAEKMMEKARETNDYNLLKHWAREAAFHGSGHYLHTIFWFNMSPNGGGKPSGQLLKQIELDFGNFERFKQNFTASAEQVEGVGWALLVWVPRAGRLEILQTEKHQFFTQWDTIPLLVLDVWEHAYYLQYKNERKKYIDNWWNVVNWNNVAERFTEAKKVQWKKY